MQGQRCRAARRWSRLRRDGPFANGPYRPAVARAWRGGGDAVSTPTRQLSFRTGRHGRRAAARPRLRGWLWPAVLLLVLAIAGAGGWRLYTSPWLVISEVRVSGAQALSPDDLRETAAIAGQRYFTANTAAAAKRLLALPRVKSATVTRRFPHTATISVVERQPAGVWLSGGVEYVVG